MRRFRIVFWGRRPGERNAAFQVVEIQALDPQHARSRVAEAFDLAWYGRTLRNVDVIELT